MADAESLHANPLWGLVCFHCRHEFPDNVTLGVVGEHFIIEHPLEYHSTISEVAGIRLELVWKGEGEAPTAVPGDLFG